MKIEFNIPCRQKLSPPKFRIEPASEPQGRAPRIARLLALAHKLDGLVRSGTVRDYAELARLGHVSTARVSQIMTLLLLAPAIQEYVLFLSADEARFLTEPNLRTIAREPRWGRQRACLERFIRGVEPAIAVPSAIRQHSFAQF
jgi:hypothetical protein